MILRQFILKSGARLFYPVFSKIFLGGENETEALNTFQKLQQQGIIPLSNILGEEIQTSHELQITVDSYCAHIENLQKLKKDRKIQRVALSLKPTQFGAGMPHLHAVWHKGVQRVVYKAWDAGLECMFDAEKPDVFDLTYQISYWLYNRRNYENIGLCFQANRYNERAIREKFQRCLENGMRVRLVKGAYPGSMTNENEIRQAYCTMLEQALATKKSIVEIATHDPHLLIDALELLIRYDVPKERVRFQMLYGVFMNLQSALARGVGIYALLEKFFMEHALYCVGGRDQQFHAPEHTPMYFVGSFQCFAKKNLMSYVPWELIKHAGLHYLERRLQEGMRQGLLNMFLKNIPESWRWQKEYI